MLPRRAFTILLIGDVLTVLIISITGYLTHYAAKEAFSLRWLSTFLPFCLGWVLLAPFLGVYNAKIADRPAQIWWRAALAAWLVAPFAAWLRGLWLDSAILPIFITVLGPSAALGMIMWRLIWAALTRRKTTYG